MVAERAAMGDQLWNLNNRLESARIKEEELTKNIRLQGMNLRNLMVEKGQLEGINNDLRSQVAQTRNGRQVMNVSQDSKACICVKLQEIVSRLWAQTENY